MIKAINLAQKNTSFRAEKEKEKNSNETRILPNNMKTRVRQGFQKTSSAFIDYPVKGLQGDINSNFYEFLTMGIVPYLAGSAVFMLAFNAINKHISPQAQKVGKKMALGVVLYGVLKNASKGLVTKPVKAATGIDTEMPYENIVYPLPKEAGENANIEVQHQQRKVFDSKEFYRKDLLDKSYFDNVAKKLGLGDNLNDSVTEASPIIQNVVATSNLAKSVSSYAWAGVGVGLAVQDAWGDFFDSISNRKPAQGGLGNRLKTMGENTVDITKNFCKSLGRACKTMWSGKPGTTGYMKHAGKAYIIAAGLLTAVLTGNTIIRAKNMAKNKNEKTIDPSVESTVV